MKKSPVLWFFIGVFCTSLVLGRPKLSRGAQEFNPHAEPTIPGLTAKLESLTLSGQQLPLDGVNCIKCKLKAPVLTYAGGEFNCEQCELAMKNITLKGAALNTVVLLQSLGVLQGPKQGLQGAPQEPVLRASFPIPAAKSVTWVSPTAK